MNLVVVYNAHSGTTPARSRLTDMFRAADITVDKYITVDNDLQRKLSPFCRKGNIIAVIGGDGTLKAVAAIVYKTNAIFAPLPGGTLNHFTKDAGIPQDLELAIAALPHAKHRKIDIAMVNNELFLNNSSIGIYPTSLQTRKRFEDKLKKWPAAAVASVRTLILFRIYTVTIENKTYRTPFIFVGNNHYDINNGGARLNLDSGVLCAYIIKSDKRRTLFRLLFSVITGIARYDNDLISLTSKKFIIHSKRNKLNVSTDGELITLTTPIMYESLPNGLTILS